MLSIKALEWLDSVHYGDRNHDERMALIEAAKIAYPKTEEDALYEEQAFRMTLGLG